MTSALPKILKEVLQAVTEGHSVISNEKAYENIKLTVQVSI